MTIQEIADRLVALCRKGEYAQAIEELYADDAVSIEPEGSPNPQTKGKANLLKKGEFFNDMIQEWHGGEVSDPVVAEDFFSLQMGMDVTFKEGGRVKDDEICVYGVKDGKIVSEQFFFVQKPMS